MILEVEPRPGLPKEGSDDPEDEDNTNPKPTPSNPKPKKKKRPVSKSVVSVHWDPWHQQWVHVVECEFTPGVIEYFYKATDDFPQEYKKDNKFNDPANGDKPQSQEQSDSGSTGDHDLSYGPVSSSEDLKDDGFYSTMREAQNNPDSSKVVRAVGSGAPLDSRNLHDNVYGYIGSAYQMFTPAGKPVCSVYPGAELTGAQLNVITGSNDYDPALNYTVTSVRADYWVNEHGQMLGHDTLEDQSFINVNKGNGRAPRWVTKNAHVNIEAKISQSQKESENEQTNFMKNETRSRLEGIGLFNYAEATDAQITDALNQGRYWSPPSISIPQSGDTSPIGGINLFPQAPDLGIVL